MRAHLNGGTVRREGNGNGGRTTDFPGVYRVSLFLQPFPTMWLCMDRLWYWIANMIFYTLFVLISLHIASIRGVYRLEREILKLLFSSIMPVNGKTQDDIPFIHGCPLPLNARLDQQTIAWVVRKSWTKSLTSSFKHLTSMPEFASFGLTVVLNWFNALVSFCDS